MKTKTCSKCGIPKDVTDFHRRGTKYQPMCKSCKQLISKQRYVEQKERLDAINAKWRSNNKEYKAQLNSLWAARNKPARAATTAKYRARKLNATPNWLTDSQWKDIKKIYEYANTLGFHVDHIVPLQGTHVSGLHVPCNLQVLSPRDNQSKGNKYE